MATSPTDAVQHLARATSEHDLDAIVACFATDYVNRTPTHPGRGFVGSEQVRRNWSQILGGVPDLDARVLATVADGDTVWSEWEMTGTRRDGMPHLMRGVIIFVVSEALVRSARFYLEPVETESGTVGDFVRTSIAPDLHPEPS
jgi:ketosteroid isomerase-like protein